MSNFFTASGIIIFLVSVFLIFATVIMPVVVILIYRQVGKAVKTLEAMEHMMRYGKD